MPLFKPKYIPSSEYTIRSKDGSCTFIRGEYVHNKKALEDLRALVCPSVPAKKATLKILVASAKSILDTMHGHTEKLYKAALVTADAKKFFENMGAVQQDFERAAEIEKYVYYGAFPVSVSSSKFKERFQIEVRHLIDRAYKAAGEKTNPEKAREKAYQGFQPFLAQMDGKSLQKLNAKFGKIA